MERLETPTGDWSITMASGCCGRNVWWISELLPEPATPVTTVSTPVGISTLTFCRLLALAFLIGSLPLGLRKSLLDRDRLLHVSAGQRIGVQQILVAALEDDLAALLPGVGTHIDDVIRHFDHVRIVLHDEDGVALVAQLLQQLIQAMHVAWVQSDARLVEDIHHVHQAAAQMLDDLDALRFAAGKRVGFAVQAEIFQADIDQMLQPLDQCVHDRRRQRVLDAP